MKLRTTTQSQVGAGYLIFIHCTFRRWAVTMEQANCQLHELFEHSSSDCPRTGRGARAKGQVDLQGSPAHGTVEECRGWVNKINNGESESELIVHCKMRTRRAETVFQTQQAKMLPERVCRWLGLIMLAGCCVLQVQDVRANESCVSATSTFATVIDTTYSMGDDIAEVCDFMNLLAASVAERFNDFLFVPFNDVGGNLTPYGPAKRLATARALGQEVCRWPGRVTGGGDCNELSLSGLSLAIQESSPDSVIVVFTDAGAKDVDKLGSVLSEIRRKRLKVFFLLSKTCGDPRSPGYLAYDTIASTSGGQVSMLREVDIPELLRFILVGEGSLSCRSNPLVLSESRPNRWSKSFIIPANTDTLTAQVSCQSGRPFAQLMHGSSANRGPVSTVNLPNGLLLTTSNPTSGGGTILIMHSSRCSVSVVSVGCNQASAVICGFSARRRETVSRVPTADVTNFHFQSQPGVRITRLRFISPDGRILNERSLNSVVTSSDGKFSVGRYRLPRETFRLEISGVDRLNRRFSTLSATAYDASLLRSPVAIAQVPVTNRFTAVRCAEVTVRCSVRLDGLQVPVTWAKDGRTLAADHRLGISGTRGEVLTFRTVVRSDEGVYTCFPATASGQRTYVAVHMTVQDNPGIPEEDCNVCSELRCPDSPVLEWHHNNTQLSSGPEYTILRPDTLRSCRRPLSDRAGVYTCVTQRGTWSFTVTSTFHTFLGSVTGAAQQRETVLGGCDVHGNVQHGAVRYSASGRGTRAEFSCQPGYTLSGRARSDCVSGTWSSAAPPVCLVTLTAPPATTPPPAPSTVVGGCEYLPAIDNARVRYTTVDCTTRAAIICSHGYTVGGQARNVIHCVAGSWTASAGRCVALPAPTLPPPPPTTSAPDCDGPLRAAQALAQTLQRTIVAMQQQIVALRSTVLAKDKEISDLTDQVETHQLTITGLRTTIGEQVNALSALTTIQTENDRLKEQAATARLTVQQLTGQGDTLRATVTAEQEKVKDCQAKLSVIQGVLGTCPAP
eukprot:scpid27229/ scgid33735/ Hemicentin-1; Fibulin-6